VTQPALDCDAVVVGSGIVGVAVAAELAGQGRDVVVVDAGSPLFGSSMCNAGQVVGSHVLPFAEPGMVTHGLRSLVRRDGAFAISPRHLLQSVPWLAEFARNCTLANVERAAPALAWLARASGRAVDRLSDQRPDLLVEHGGLVSIYHGAAEFEAGRRHAAQAARYGVRFSELTPADLVAASPRLRKGMAGGIWYEGDRSLDPAALWTVLDELARTAGATAIRATVRTIEPVGKAALVRTDDGVVRAGHVVVCAGAWTADLLRPLGVRLRLRAAKGYSVTLPGCSSDLGWPFVLVEPHLAVNPLPRGLRISSRYEITSARDRDLDGALVRRLLSAAARYIEIDDDVRAADVWTGVRPAMADGFPVIGRIPGAEPVLVATGHGMTGTAASLGTAAIIADLIAGRPIPAELAVLAPGRGL
jgi:D-amino-acid dehydrogenase